MAYSNHPETQTLLMGHRHPAIPTTTAHWAEQMESGGARVEDVLNRFKCTYPTLFFAAGLLTVLGASLSLLGSLFMFQLANVVVDCFLIIFGIAMMLLDIPGNPRWASRYRSILRKYARFLTRMTGKGLWFLFLGCLVACSLWPSRRGKISMLFPAICISLFIVSVAIVGLLIAIRKSLRLDKVRRSVLSSSSNSTEDVYKKYALSDPQHGMQCEEFNRLCSDHTSGNIQFNMTDLGMIYNALDDYQKFAINGREFAEWLRGSMTFL